MIKYLGTVGVFLHPNSSEDVTYNLLNIYSSSVADTVLFSASINNYSGQINKSSASTSIYINGISGSVVSSNQWSHVTFSFDEKLWTYDSNNFLIRFGDTDFSNFNIQNLYILESSFDSNDIGYLHQQFTGGTSNKLFVSSSSLYSININDFPENKYISASTNIIYQPLYGQYRYLTDITAATESSLNRFVSASTMTNDNLFIDTVNINSGDKVLSLYDNQIYQLNELSKLDLISSSVGDFVRVLFGQYLGNISFIKTASGFSPVPIRAKISSYLNTLQPNNT